MAPNTQVLASSATSLLLLLWVRYMRFRTFLVVVALPALLYGLRAERTRALGSLKEKTVVVTGASSGLGKAIAIEAARRGATKIILVARSVDKLRVVAEIIGQERAVVLPVDVSDAAALRAAFASLDGIDLLVNNAGMGEWKHTEDTSSEEALQMIAVPCGLSGSKPAMKLSLLPLYGSHLPSCP